MAETVPVSGSAAAADAYYAFVAAQMVKRPAVDVDDVEDVA
jgi:hypothetical protein